MKISCTQENLNKGLSIISHLAIKNTNLPILNNVLIKTQEGGILLSTTNLEMGVSTLVRAKIDKEGVFTVPANILNNFISLLNNDENVDIELINKELVIKSTNQETKIKGEDSSEFPIIPEIEKENKNIINTSDLKNALSQVVFAASLDETRIEISGVLFNFNEQCLVLAATDSYRLAEKKVSCVKKELETDVIIPQRTIQELLRILPLVNNNEVEIYINENQVLFKIGSTQLTSRLIEGNYPDYKQIIPQEDKTIITTNREELIKVIKRAALFSKSGINDVDLNFDVEKQLINIKALSSQIGENDSKKQAEIKGENNNIVFNYRYLLDGLSSIKGEKIIFKIIDNSNPGVFQGEEEDDYLYIIMPIKQ